MIPDLTVTRGRLRLITEQPDLASLSYASLAPQRERARLYLPPPESARTARYLCAAFVGATFEAWIRWAAGTDPDPAPYLLAALDVLRLPDG